MYKPSHASYQIKRCQESSTNHHKPDASANSTKKTAQSITSRMLCKTIPEKQQKASHTEYQTKHIKKIVQNTTNRILEKKQYQENSTKHRKPNTRQNNTRKTVQNNTRRILDKTVPGKQYQTSQAEYQTKQYQENGTKHYKPNTRQNNTRKTVQNITSRILDKTVPGKQYQTSQAEY